MTGGLQDLRTGGTGSSVTFRFAGMRTPEFLAAGCSTAPGFLVAAARLQGLLPAVTTRRHHLRTGGTWSRMTEEHATVTAGGLQGLGAFLFAGVRDYPGLEGRVLSLAAETGVTGRARRFRVVRATFWAGIKWLID